MAESHSDFVFGFICQHRLTDDQRFVHMVPGECVTVPQCAFTAFDRLEALCD